ncbi:MAG: TIGR03617 family F420-dependent LLM class oxidoreductase [Nocardioides sp.]|uniref:TIGR03617 family F420-dependent LLM class oxidoreductase n=1 Tax=Nocardioides sp. TaxID=35761 RepID=UPI003263BD94
MIRVDPLISQHLREAGPEAVAAEQQGFQHGWVSETVADPYAAAATALLATHDLRIGTAVSVAFARSPFAVAQSAWELSRASEGRFVLGLGTQVKAHAERRFSVEWSPPVARLRDYIQALRAIWGAFQGDGPLRYEGEFYQHTLLTDHFDPGPIEHPHVPVYVSGVNVRIAELAGELADGLLAHPLHTRSYLESVIWPAIGQGAEKAGRDPSEISLVAPAWVVTGSDDEERDASYRAIRQQIGTFGSTTAYKHVFETEGWVDLQPRLNVAMKEGGPRAAGELVPDEVVRAIAVTGRPDELLHVLDERFDGVADATMIYAPVPTPLAGTGLAEHLLP